MKFEWCNRIDSSKSSRGASSHLANIIMSMTDFKGENLINIQNIPRQQTFKLLKQLSILLSLLQLSICKYIFIGRPSRKHRDVKKLWIDFNDVIGTGLKFFSQSKLRQPTLDDTMPENPD